MYTFTNLPSAMIRTFVDPPSPAGTPDSATTRNASGPESPPSSPGRIVAKYGSSSLANRMSWYQLSEPEISNSIVNRWGRTSGSTISNSPELFIRSTRFPFTSATATFPDLRSNLRGNPPSGSRLKSVVKMTRLPGTKSSPRSVLACSCAYTEIAVSATTMARNVTYLVMRFTTQREM